MAAGRRADGAKSVGLGERKLGRAAMEKGEQLGFFGDPFRAQQVLKKGNPRRQTSDEKMVQLDR